MAEPVAPHLMILLSKPESAPKKMSAGGYAEGGEVDDKDEALESCAEDLLTAIHSHDAKGVAEELRYIFDLLESEPHKEAGEESDEGEEGPEPE